jgi:hypothetical protein
VSTHFQQGGGCGGCEGFDELVTKVSGDGLPSASVVAFHEREKEL